MTSLQIHAWSTGNSDLYQRAHDLEHEIATRYQEYQGELDLDRDLEVLTDELDAINEELDYRAQVELDSLRDGAHTLGEF